MMKVLVLKVRKEDRNVLDDLCLLDHHRPVTIVKENDMIVATWHTSDDWLYKLALELYSDCPKFVSLHFDRVRI